MLFPSTARRMRHFRPRVALGDTETFTRLVTDILREHEMVTVDECWGHLQERVEHGELKSKRHMRRLLQWMGDMQILRRESVRSGGPPVLLLWDAPPIHKERQPDPDLSREQRGSRSREWVWKPRKITLWGDKKLDWI